MTVDTLHVTPMDEGGYVVRGTRDPDTAREACRPHVIEDMGYSPDLDPPDAPDKALASLGAGRPGLYRWTPCHPRSCYDGGGHRGHLQYVDRPGRGVWEGVLFYS